MQLLNALISSEIVGSYIPYVIQNALPGVEDRDKAWIFIDTNGRPKEIRIWHDNSGMWRRVYNGMLGEIRIFSGNPGTEADWDDDGLGVPGGTYDGWHLCNGKDGTPDLSDKFILGGHMNLLDGHPQYSGGGWVSFVNGVTDQHTGGVKDNVLTADTAYIPATEILAVTRWKADGNAADAGSGLFGLPVYHGTAPTGTTTLIPADDGNTTPGPIENIPPFIAMGFIIFVGYA